LAIRIFLNIKEFCVTGRILSRAHRLLRFTPCLRV
jgi:hypothetical protein